MNKEALDLERVRRPWLENVLDFEQVEWQGTVFSTALTLNEVSMADSAYHDREAEWYDNYLLEERTALSEGWIVPRMVQLLRSGVIVDIGCGTGRVAEQLIRAGNKVIAVDHSMGMLQKTVDKIPSLALVPVYADVRKLPLCPGSCDGVVCSGVLHHIPDWPVVLWEITRVLRPGGRLVVREPNADYAIDIFTPLETKLAVLNRWLAHFRKDAQAHQADSERYEDAPYEQRFSIEDLRDKLPPLLQTEFAVATEFFGSLGLEPGFPLRGLYYRIANTIDRWLFDRRYPIRRGSLLFTLATRVQNPQEEQTSQRKF